QRTASYATCTDAYARTVSAQTLSARLAVAPAVQFAPRMPSTRAKLPLALLAIAAGCSHELSGPTPTVSSLDPTIVCTEQLMTDVNITATGLSPLSEAPLPHKPPL